MSDEPVRTMKHYYSLDPESEELIRRALERTADLRRTYTELTGREAPARWASPNWLQIDGKEISAAIAEDFIAAFEDRGIDMRDAYGRQGVMFADGYVFEWLWRDDLVRKLAAEAVAYRIERRKARSGA